MLKYLAFYVERTTDSQWSLFSLKSRTFELGQTNWVDKFWGIWGIFGWTSNQHPSWYSESLVHVFHDSTIELSLYIHLAANDKGFSLRESVFRALQQSANGTCFSDCIYNQSKNQICKEHSLKETSILRFFINSFFDTFLSDFQLCKNQMKSIKKSARKN